MVLQMRSFDAAKARRPVFCRAFEGSLQRSGGGNSITEQGVAEISCNNSAMTNN